MLLSALRCSTNLKNRVPGKSNTDDHIISLGRHYVKMKKKIVKKELVLRFKS